MAGPYNIKEDVKEGDPEHPEHHVDLAKAVNDLDGRVTEVKGTAEDAATLASNSAAAASSAETAAQNAATAATEAAAEAGGAVTLANEAKTIAEGTATDLAALDELSVKTDDSRLTDERDPKESSAAGSEVGWVRGVFRNSGDTLPSGLPADTLVIERP